MKESEVFIPPHVPEVYDLSNDAYHSSVGLSRSGLAEFARSPLHYWAAYLDPKREPRPRTPALILGEQIHTAILEPAQYFERYYPLPQKYDLRTNFGKREFDYHSDKAASLSKEIITADNHEICQRIAESVHESAAASTLFEADGIIEQTFFATDAQSEVMVKCKPDKLLTSGAAIVDVKSTADASPSAFQKSIWNYGYHIQAAWYLRTVELVTGERPRAFVFCAFEKEPPYACAFYAADADMIGAGEAHIREMLLKFADCHERNYWPGYDDRIVDISLPAYALKSI